MTKKVNWKAISTGNRNAVIEYCKTAITEREGCILNFQLFSDLALSLVIEIEEKYLTDLYETLSQVASISESPPDGLDLHSEASYWVLIHISFSRGKGELEIEVPEVPG